jgi:bidirectional [NiFe] hydrogenase diaphorase subunit
LHHIIIEEFSFCACDKSLTVFFISTLCFHEKLEPYGACRICTVEIDANGWTKLVAACLYPVEQDLVVKTRSEKVDKIRKMILEFLLAHAPNSPQLQELAQEYGADKDRFEKSPPFAFFVVYV